MDDELNLASRAAEHRKASKQSQDLYEKHVKDLVEKSSARFQKFEESVKNIESNDKINSPKHYTQHPSGIECITIAEHMGFNLGNALKYIWRADLKDSAIDDLRKAAWYINREIEKRLKYV